MAAVVIFSPDASVRDTLERLLRAEPGISIVGLAREPPVLERLLRQFKVDAVLADAPPTAELDEWSNRHPATAFVVLAGNGDEDEAIDALHAGARAVVARGAGRAEISAAIVGAV